MIILSCARDDDGCSSNMIDSCSITILSVMVFTETRLFINLVLDSNWCSVYRSVLLDGVCPSDSVLFIGNSTYSKLVG